MPQIWQNSYLEKYIQTKHEMSFFKATNYPTIDTLNEEGRLQLIDLLAKWRFMVGVSVANEKEAAQELYFIQSFIFENYGNRLNLKQIEHALNLSLLEELEVDTRTFNVFSPMYVSKVLNAYLKEQINVFRELKARHEVDYSQIEQPKPDPTKMAEDMKEIIKSVYSKYEAEGVVYDAFSYLYNYFKKKGLLDLSKETVDEAVKYGDLMLKKDAEEKPRMFSAGMMSLNKDSIRKSHSRAYVVQKLFEKTKLDDLILCVQASDFDGNIG